MNRVTTLSAAGLGMGAAWWLWERRSRARVDPSGLLDALLPGAQFRDQVVVPIDAPADDIWRALTEVRLRDMPLAWALGELRYLPSRLVRRSPAGPGDQPFMGIVRSDAGIRSIVLADVPDHELVLGVIGRLHEPTDRAFVPLEDAAAFHAFDEPGYEKLALSLRVVPAPDGPGRLLILEHRTLALDEEARRRFARYWLGIRPGGALVSGQLLRAVRRRAEAASASGILAPED
jgi:hypothetical protein